MPSTVKPCLTCGVPTSNGSRCKPHQAQHETRRVARRGTREQRGYGRTWIKARARAIRQQPFCSNCGATEDLTGDHVVPLARGGTIETGVGVLCRSCNARKGGKI